MADGRGDRCSNLRACGRRRTRTRRRAHQIPAECAGQGAQHLCDFSTLVLQGELLFRHPDGSLKEVRPTGSYVQGKAHGAPHSEGAGELIAIVLFSFRDAAGSMVLYLDTPTDEPFHLSFSDFKATQANQIATGATAKLGARAA